MASNPDYFVYELYAICSLAADIMVHLDEMAKMQTNWMFFGLCRKVRVGFQYQSLSSAGKIVQRKWYFQMTRIQV